MKEHRKYKMEVMTMIKANAVAMNDMELDMVAGGGFFSDLKQMSDDLTIKDDDSMLKQTAKTVVGAAILGALGYGALLVLTHGRI